MLSKNVNVQESSQLCGLPREILEFIWEELDIVPRIVLMVACKQFAEMGKLRGTKPPPADEIEYYWMLSRLASWMPSGLRLCGKCRMYRMRATEQYDGSDWCRLWLQERWIVTENSPVRECTSPIFMCPVHHINYKALGRLEEIQRDLQPPGVIILPSEGTGGLAVRLH